jgi:hypothetical protein
MNELQLLVANLVRTAVLLILVGLFVRKRAHLCWSFTLYLATILVGNSMVAFWPERFYARWFYILKESVYNVLMLCVAAEMAYRVFRAFPGALARARLVLAPLLALITVGVISVPKGIDYIDIVTRYHPQLQTGIIWLLSATAVLSVWYNLPLARIHRVLLLGMSSHLIVFATLANVARSFGYERTRVFLSAIDTYAYLVLVTWWAYTAWRSEEALEVTPMRAPELAAKPA